jgi:N-acetylglucosaminyl-diphospho-decaprenol L-rhamnosyltransferase
MDLSIIIVSWNVSDLLQKCLQSVLDSPHANTRSMEIIVVDSASTDNTVEMLQKCFPQVKLFTQSENVGYTRGNNIGLEAAQGRCLLLLNPDTEIIGDALVKMVNYLDENPSVGIIGPHTLNSDGTTQSSRRRFLTRTLAFFESTWLQPYAPESLLDYFYVNGEPDNGVFDVDWVQGSALMARREIYDQIGGLDTGYVMYCEEMDWCKRAKDAGWRVVYLGTAQLTHHGGKSTDQAGARRHIYFQESKLRYCRKNFGRGFAFILRLFLLVSYVWQIGREGIRYLVGHKRPMRQERIRTYWQVLRSGLKVT